MGCAAEATGLGFVCFVGINPVCCQPAELILGFFSFINFPILLSPPTGPLRHSRRSVSGEVLDTFGEVVLHGVDSLLEIPEWGWE